ncbi:MAG: NAD-dependent epimerase/dehydratase family protein [Candidatus Aminicenantia bacterium]
MKVLVTGANGFVGSNLCEGLIKKGYNVRGLVRNTSDLSLIRNLNVELTYGELGNIESIEGAMKGMDIVYHVAALSSDWGPLELFLRTNVGGTRNVLGVARKSNLKKFVYISSVVVHGFESKVDVDENSSFTDTPFPYCISKKKAEELVWEYYNKYKLPITIIRPGNVFGPRDRVTFLKIAEAIDKGYMPYVKGGKAITCLTYIENLVDAIILAGESEKAIGQAYIITDGTKVTWREFAEAIAKEMRRKKPFLSFWGPFAYFIAWMVEAGNRILKREKRPLITRYLVTQVRSNFHFSIEKAKKELGYNPRISFEEAIRRSVKWYLNQKEGKPPLDVHYLTR